MAEVIWTDHALVDLNQIAEYIAVSNLPAAKNLVATILVLRGSVGKGKLTDRDRVNW